MGRGFLGGLHRIMFRRRLRDQLPLLPREMSIEYDRHVSRDVGRIFEQTGSRSPHGVEVLMRRYGVATPRELLAVLPVKERRRRSAWERLEAWVMRGEAAAPEQPIIRDHVQKLIRQKVIDRKDRVIRRSQIPKRKV